jgi:Mg2+/Co2+ transporter CorB
LSNDVPLAALLGLLVLLLLLSAFFSASETALMSINRYRLRHRARAGHRGARLAESLLQRPDRLIGLILLGNNLVNFSAAALVAIISFQVGGQPAVAIGTFIITLVVLIFGEAAPKTLAALNPERIAYPAAYVYYPLTRVLYPIVWLISAASNAVLYLFGVRQKDVEGYALSREELRTIVYEAGARISSRYRHMLLNILDLEKVTVEDVMIPRNEIIGIDLDMEMGEISKNIDASEHSRLPVYRDNIDHVIGVLHLRCLANRSNKTGVGKADIEALVTDPYFVPEGTPLNTQLHQFQKAKQQFALVVDEYGDIQGIVTLEDILEEIVGEFTTVTASDEQDIVRDGENSFLVSGGANIRDLNRVMNWKLPTDGPKTLNGLILEYLETIPEPGVTLRIEGYPIEIVETTENRVKSARIQSDGT